MDAQVFTPDEVARAARQRAAGQLVLDVVAGMDKQEGMMAVALAMSTLCAAIAQEVGSSPEGAADLARRMLGVVERNARQQFGHVRQTPAGRH